MGLGWQPSNKTSSIAKLGSLEPFQKGNSSGSFLVCAAPANERDSMADGGNIQRDYKLETNEYGILDKAGAEVWMEFEPKDQHTKEVILDFLAVHGLHSDRPSTQEKFVWCMSDVIMATQHSTNGLICWPFGNEHFTGAAYGADIANKIKNFLFNIGLLSLHQKSSKSDGLARIYRCHMQPWMSDLKFKPHGKGPAVEVRSPKVRRGATITGGKKLSRRQFLQDIQTLEADIRAINAMLMTQPLTDSVGKQYGVCKRIFNQGSLKAGGRLMGRWQSLPEVDRLHLLIGNEPVCEIDIKAMFLSICNAQFGSGVPFQHDPYLMIPFVRQNNDPETQKAQRKLAKLLISAFFSNGGKIHRFPKGKKVVDGKVIPIKKQYNLPSKAKATDYYGDILSTFPFLRDVPITAYDLMYQESEIIIQAMKYLQQSGIVTYPVHDCLLTKVVDEHETVLALQDAMLEILGSTMLMDVTYQDQTSKIIPPREGVRLIDAPDYMDFWEDDDDFDVLE